MTITPYYTRGSKEQRDKDLDMLSFAEGMKEHAVKHEDDNLKEFIEWVEEVYTDLEESK